MDYSLELKAIENDLEKIKMYYFNEKGKLDQLISQKKLLEDEFSESEFNINILEKVRILLQKVSEYAREQSRQQIENMVTNCLQFIFDSDIQFMIEIDEVRGRAEAEFYTVSRLNDETVKMKPQYAKGGGIVDIISLAVRIAMLHCSNINIEGPLILDEPAKHVSDDFIVQVGEFLKEINRRFDRQVILVTHNAYLKDITDKSYRIEGLDGMSIVLNDS